MLSGEPNQTVSVNFTVEDSLGNDVTADCTITAEVMPSGFSIDQPNGRFISDGSMLAGTEALVVVTATYESENLEYTDTATVTVSVTRDNNP